MSSPVTRMKCWHFTFLQTTDMWHFACFINATPTFLQNLSSHIQITCMVAVWDGGYVTARRDGGQVKPDIFNEMSWQCPAVLVATEPGKPKHDFFPNPNQTISAALSQHPSVLLSRVRFCRRRRVFKTSLSPAMLFELLLRDQGIPSPDELCNPPSEFWVCPRVSMAEPSQNTEESHFSCSYPWSNSIGHEFGVMTDRIRWGLERRSIGK